MNTSFQFDTRNFEQALELYMKHTKRSIPEVVNRAAVDVIIKSAERTLTTTAAKIKSELTQPSVSTTPKSGTPKRGKQQAIPAPIVYRIVNARRKDEGKPGISGSYMGEEARKLIASRMSSTKYVAYAGWQKALIAVGGRGFGQKVKSGSPAYDGYGKKATVNHAVAELCNKALNGENLKSARQQSAYIEISDSAAAAFYSALEEKAADMRAEAIRRMKEKR